MEPLPLLPLPLPPAAALVVAADVNTRLLQQYHVLHAVRVLAHTPCGLGTGGARQLLLLLLLARARAGSTSIPACENYQLYLGTLRKILYSIKNIKSSA